MWGRVFNLSVRPCATGKRYLAAEPKVVQIHLELDIHHLVHYNPVSCWNSQLLLHLMGIDSATRTFLKT